MVNKQFYFFFYSLGHSPDPSNALGAAQVYRSFDINFITTKEIFCEKTEETKTAWTILKLEDDPRTLPSNVPLADIRKSEFHSVNDSTELTLPGRFLPYGFYEIRARVEMRGLKDVFGTDSTFLEIIQTPWLEPVVKGGSLHTVPFGFVVSLVSTIFIVCTLMSVGSLQITTGNRFFFILL